MQECSNLSHWLSFFLLPEALYVTMNVKGDRRDRGMISMVVVVPAGSELTLVDTSPIAKEIAVRVLKRSDCNMAVLLRAYNRFQAHAICKCLIDL